MRTPTTRKKSPSFTPVREKKQIFFSARARSVKSSGWFWCSRGLWSKKRFLVSIVFGGVRVATTKIFSLCRFFALVTVVHTLVGWVWLFLLWCDSDVGDNEYGCSLFWNWHVCPSYVASQAPRCSWQSACLQARTHLTLWFWLDVCVWRNVLFDVFLNSPLVCKPWVW